MDATPAPAIEALLGIATILRRWRCRVKNAEVSIHTPHLKALRGLVFENPASGYGQLLYYGSW